MTWPKLDHPIAQIIVALAVLVFAVGTSHKFVAALNKLFADQNKRRSASNPKTPPATINESRPSGISETPSSIPELPSFSSVRPPVWLLAFPTFLFLLMQGNEIFSTGPATRGSVIIAVFAVGGMFFMVFTYFAVWIVIHIYKTMLVLSLQSTQLTVDAAMTLPRAITKAAELSETKNDGAK